MNYGMRLVPFTKEKIYQYDWSPNFPYGKVVDGIVYVLRTDDSGNCYLNDMVLVLHVTDNFNNEFS